MVQICENTLTQNSLYPSLSQSTNICFEESFLEIIKGLNTKPKKDRLTSKEAHVI